MEFEEAYRNFVQTNGLVGTIIELERVFIKEFREDATPSLGERVKNACIKLQNAYEANMVPEGDPRRLRNIVCYKRLNDKVREFRK
ncbi:MAG: hypothetical protein PHO02_00775 [Candidatus Nanoarchaeia archaeon]|nr:hypothetical protein [Candidatus Nanoarchaeia archaeon]